MHSKATKDIFEPVQDIAISSLLQIDSRQQQDIDVWQEKRIVDCVNTNHRTFSSHKPYTKSFHLHQNIRNASPRQNNRDSRPNYHLAMLKELSHEQINNNPQEDQTANGLLAKSTQFNQGQYWSSKVNWMSEEHRKGHKSQPKLNKKFSFGYEVNARTGKNSGKNCQEEKTRQNQYKTNLIYSLLTHKNAFTNNKQDNQKGRYADKPHSSSSSKNPLKKMTNFPMNDDKKGRNFSGHMHQYMREQLKKLYLKNKRNSNPGISSPIKSSQHNSMIRELLINIENLRDYQNCNMTSSAGSTTPDLSKSNGIDFTQEVIETAKMPQRKLYHLSQHQYIKHVLDINKQIGRSNRGRPIHQASARPPSPIKN